jgi:hypothetical protein
LSGLIGVMLLSLQTTCHRARLEGMQVRRGMALFAKLMVNEQSRRHCRELVCFHRGRRCPDGQTLNGSSRIRNDERFQAATYCEEIRRCSINEHQIRRF